MVLRKSILDKKNRYHLMCSKIQPQKQMTIKSAQEKLFGEIRSCTRRRMETGIDGCIAQLQQKSHNSAKSLMQDPISKAEVRFHGLSYHMKNPTVI